MPAGDTSRNLFRGLTESETSWGWWESGTLLAFAATVSAGIRWHEGWVDEAQAWLIARDMGWWQMMLHGIRYEGTPGLWHSVLWVLARLHFRYTGMHWVAGLIAVAGGYVMLRFAPFPRFLKLVLPFTFFIAYQDAVVARGYVLYTALGFGVAALLRHKIDRPILLAVVLGLIANISIHGCIASGGLAFVAFMQARRTQAGQARAEQSGFPKWSSIPRNILKTRYAGAGALLLCFWLVAIGTAAPPRDLDFAAAKSLHKARTWITSAHGTARGGHWLYGNDEIPVDPDPGKPHLVTKADAAQSLTMQPGELAPIPSAIPHRPLGTRLWLKVANFLGVITFPISESRILALATVASLFALALTRTTSLAGKEDEKEAGENEQGWVALVPWCLMVVAFSKLYLAPRHAGMLFITFLISVWLAWPAKRESHPARWQQVTLSVLLLLVAAEQIGWTRYAILMDKRYPYSGDWTTARFLRDQAETKNVAGFYYHATGALAFLKDFKYVNQPHSYWVWSTKIRTDQQAPAVLKQHPDYVVVGGFTWGNQGSITVDWADPLGDLPYMPMADSYRIVNYFERHGYIETHRMCGRLLMRNGYSEEVCNIVLEPYVAED